MGRSVSVDLGQGVRIHGGRNGPGLCVRKGSSASGSTRAACKLSINTGRPHSRVLGPQAKYRGTKMAVCEVLGQKCCTARWVPTRSDCLVSGLPCFGVRTCQARAPTCFFAMGTGLCVRRAGCESSRGGTMTRGRKECIIDALTRHMETFHLPKPRQIASV